MAGSRSAPAIDESEGAVRTRYQRPSTPLPARVIAAATDALAGPAPRSDQRTDVRPTSTTDYTGALIPGYGPASGGNDSWGIDIKPATQVMNGDTLTEYARIRHVIGHGFASYGLDPSTTGASDDILTVASVDKIQSIVAAGLASVPTGIDGSGGGGGGLSC
jgi:hypothetical protein